MVGAAVTGDEAVIQKDAFDYVSLRHLHRVGARASDRQVVRGDLAGRFVGKEDVARLLGENISLKHYILADEFSRMPGDGANLVDRIRRPARLAAERSA